MSRGPILTLLAVLAFGVTLLGINVAAQEPSPAPTATSDVATAAPTPEAPPPTTTSTPPPTTEAAPVAPTPFPAKVKYVGEAETAKGPIPLSVTIDGDRAKVYVCDNKSIEVWLQGNARDGAVEASGKKGARLSARHEGDRLVGTVTVPGYPTWDFTATPTKNPKAGVYRATGGGRTTGWVVPDDARRQVGLAHDARGAVVPARPLDVDAPLPAGTAPVDATTDVLAGP